MKTAIYLLPNEAKSLLEFLEVDGKESHRLREVARKLRHAMLQTDLRERSKELSKEAAESTTNG